MAEEHAVRLLDTNTANQIAAGEVVEKPASVVKELVENALDAGADKIEVTIFAGGTEYIRVTDNGCGMSEADAKMAVLRHATSKLTKAEDLLSLNTLGFRGEALPSIASVSNFTLLTRPESEEFATSVHIDGGENTEVTASGGSTGTTVIVENLFFNVPARRKFLKTVSTEGRYISELLTRLALSRPDVRFKLVNNDKEVLSTPGDGDLEHAIKALYGKNVAENLLEVSLNDPKVRVSGFIGKPTLLKGTRQWQTFFVNGRCIGSKMLSKAMDHAYQSQIPKSGFPFAVINLTVDTASVDVNVHPQKSEIKFSDDSLIYKAMYKALTDALTKPMSAQKTQVTLLPDSELNVFVKPQPQAACAPVTPAPQPKPAYQPVFKGGAEQIFKTPERNEEQPAAEELLGNEQQPVPAVKKEQAEQQAMWQPFDDFNKTSATVSYTKGYQEPVLEVHEARSEFAKPQPTEAAPVPNRETIAFTDTDSGMDTIWPIGQVDKTFIIAQSENTLYLIDQHAAHERILYDKLVASHEQIPSQQLLMPLYVDMAADDIALIEEHRDEFLALGVDAASAGESLLRVSSLPADIKADAAEDFINAISKMLREMRNVNGSDLRQEVLHMTACKAAIKAGQLLNMRQMRQLIIDLCNTTHPFTCPHGRPCMIEIDSNQLYKMFKRTGF
ncbi:dNA mismatch repair protein [Phascolarctobacterium succinatutens CAG:287]|uniref:DNA mismatch repair protein MutL n=1 Tax=Phascolarctobacterium succinatutens CAG:287 TaxID=1263101 RepID=R6WZI5_9FIRM|nr:DNA mismatch repair endonuclease MutL [Phascolarctobacterium succinatutens]CDD12324.1 dNA mismatch repair protein [Phascolarctobacterium succinatutens CAG:287]